MIKRRTLVLGAAACGATTPMLTACTTQASEQQAALALRRPMDAILGDRPKLTSGLVHGLAPELVRYATLAPSSHNTQCWRFSVAQPGNTQGTTQTITIAPDFSRRCPVVDPDDHHLFVSLGCATENLAHAALAHGLMANAQFSGAADAAAIDVHLDATKAVASALFQAIPARQCTRGDYDGKPLTAAELRLLEQAGSGPGVRVMLLTERTAIEQVLAYVVAGNALQLNDMAFMAELKTWIRFGADEALRMGDGLFAAATGNPAVPRWLGSRLMDWVVTAKSENDRYTRQVRSSAGIAVFVSEANEPAHWIEAGRCYERFALQATALGIRNAFLNQPVEAASIRPQFASWLGVSPLRPDLIVRFGRGPALPWSMRRPVQAVLA